MNFLKKLLYKIFFPIGIKTLETAAPVRIRNIITQKLFRINHKAYWPTHYTSVISNPENIIIGIGTAPGLSPGCYIQGIGQISIGDYTIIGPNVVIVSANHDLYDSRLHEKNTVKIGNYSWIGANSTILPGVDLGDHTIVAAGSVVTKSFEKGHVVLAGSPAKIVKVLDKSKCIKYKNQYEYYGFIPKSNFRSFVEKNLSIKKDNTD